MYLPKLEECLPDLGVLCGLRLKTGTHVISFTLTALWNCVELEQMNRFRQDDSASNMLARDSQWLLPVYARFPVVMERGDGVYLYDTSGNRYLDMMGGLGVNALGHAHPRMVKATAEQAARMVHLSPQYCTPSAGALAEQLCRLSGMSGVFYSTGGSESVEGAIKLARAFGTEQYRPSKFRIAALEGSYHGRTFGSMSVTGQAKYRDGFGPVLDGVDLAVKNDIASLRAAVNEDTCAILLETVLGEGGVHELSTAFLQEARRLADEFNALLILDEIQCGLGRTGEWFAFEQSGVRPDVLILGKPLGGGLPLSAFLVSGELFHVLGIGRHGSTLGGSPMACQLGLEFLSAVEDEGLLSRVLDTGAYLAAAPAGAGGGRRRRRGGTWPRVDPGAGVERAGPAHCRSRAGAGHDVELCAGQRHAVSAGVSAGTAPCGQHAGRGAAAAEEGGGRACEPGQGAGRGRLSSRWGQVQFCVEPRPQRVLHGGELGLR